MELTLDLADGFSHEHVIVVIDGREILNAQGVTTKQHDGRALRLTHVAEGREVSLQISVPRRAARVHRIVRLGSYVRVNLDCRGSLHLIEQHGSPE
jgi:hypothetical protein